MRLFLLMMVLCTPMLALAQADEPMTVRVAMAQPENLDPVSVSRFDLNKSDLIENLFVGLTRLNATTGEIEPQLALNWSVSPDGLTWTFKLRNDIQWVEVQNGEAVALRPVVASDVVFALQRACDPTRPSPVTANIVVIKGCADVQRRLDTWAIDQVFLDRAIGVRAIDEQTLEIQLLFPASYFLTMTTLPEFRPLPRERVSGVWPLATTIVTSGAWIVSRWDGSHVQLDSNPFWPLEREGNVERVEIWFDLNRDALSVQLSSGVVDVARIDGRTAQTVRLGNAELVNTTEGQTLYLIGFSFEYSPLDKPLVRQALTQALDRSQLAGRLVGLGNESYQGVNRFTPMTVVASPSTDGVTFDAAMAQQTLANAGHAQCTGFPGKMTLVVEDTQLAITIGQFVVQQWQQHLGCIFEVATANRQALIDSAHATLETTGDTAVPRFQLWLITWTADYPDANAWTSDALHCQFGFLKTGRFCDVSDTMLDQGGISLDLQTRFNTYGQAELGFFGVGGSFPVIPLVITQSHIAVQSWLENVGSYGALQFDRWEFVE